MGTTTSAADLPSESVLQPSKVLPAKDWEQLMKLPVYFPAVCTDLDPRDLRMVVSLLKIGNLTTDAEGVRRLNDEELSWLCDAASVDINACHSQITRVFCDALMPAAMQVLNNNTSPKSGITQLPKQWTDGGLLLKALKALVGNETWSLNNNDPKTFEYVRDQALHQLRRIARDGETRIYPKIRDAFGTLKVPRRTKHRLDDRGVIPYRKTLHLPLHTVIADEPPPSDELEFLILLQYLAILIDPFFQAKAKALATSNNQGDWQSCWRAPPTKTWVRMAAKMANPNDHGNEREPKAAANIDMSRCALTFQNPSDLVTAFNECRASTDLKVLRVKNNFAESFPAETETFGYRSIMANLLFMLPVTWAQLLDQDESGFLPQLFRIGQKVRTDDAGNHGILLGFNAKRGVVEVQQYDGKGPSTVSPARLLEMNRKVVDEKLQKWRKKIHSSLKSIAHIDALVMRLQFSFFLNKDFLAFKVKFIVEIQFLLAEYLRMRKQSHIWCVCVVSDMRTSLLN